MIDPVIPKYQWGQQVRALQPLLNDGSYPNRPPEALLAAEGMQGEIVQVGMHVDLNTPIYLVEFAADCVVGCLETEIAPL